MAYSRNKEIILIGETGLLSRALRDALLMQNIPFIVIKISRKNNISNKNQLSFGVHNFEGNISHLEYLLIEPVPILYSSSGGIPELVDKYKEIAKNKKIGRNEPCYCGSGKKFKHCCGAL